MKNRSDTPTAPTPSGGAAEPLTAEDREPYALNWRYNLDGIALIGDEIGGEIGEAIKRGCRRTRTAVEDALLAARRGEETRATLARENREMWNAIETALGHMREPFLLMDARYARTRLTEAYNTLQRSRARAALAATPERCNWCDLVHEGGPENCRAAATPEGP